METLGHANISITMDTYTHVMPEFQRQAVDAMDRLLERPYRTDGVRMSIHEAPTQKSLSSPSNFERELDR
jgi:hypothetical protein